MGVPLRRGFWGRRLARDEWLGRHLTLGVLLCFVLFSCFLLLSTAIQGPQPPAFDQRLGDSLRELREASPRTCTFLRGVTEMGDVRVLVPLLLSTAVVLVWQRHWKVAPALILIVLAGAFLDDLMKGVFQRQRPLLHDASIHLQSPSFPSGHSMASMIAYGMLAYLLILALPGRGWARRSAVGFLALLVLAVGFSRIYLAAHWFTDVVGGFLLGAAWLILWIALLECLRRRPARTKKIATADAALALGEAYNAGSPVPPTPQEAAHVRARECPTGN